MTERPRTAAVAGIAALAAVRMPGGRTADLVHPDHAPAPAAPREA